MASQKEIKYLVYVYLDDGRVFSYSVDSPNMLRDHMYQIIKTGYRHIDSDLGMLEWYPPHRILKVKCFDDLGSKYIDTVTGT